MSICDRVKYHEIYNDIQKIQSCCSIWIYFKTSIFYLWDNFSFYLTLSMVTSSWSYYFFLKTESVPPIFLVELNVALSIVVLILWFICYMMDPGYIISFKNY